VSEEAAVGELWDNLAGKAAEERSQDILSQKYPVERGLSAETMAAVREGEVEIVDDDPQAELLQEIAEQPEV
jgi:hypothetical protein